MLAILKYKGAILDDVSLNIYMYVQFSYAAIELK